MKHAYPYRGRTAAIGIGQSKFFKRGMSQKTSQELCLDAILDACRDAGLPPHQLEGFASFGDERTNPVEIAAALGISELKHASLCSAGGGGGVAAAFEHAACAVVTNRAKFIVVYRSISQARGQRLGQAGGYSAPPDQTGHVFPYGIMSPAQFFAFQIVRFFDQSGIDPELARSVSFAAYAHAQNNPNAVMYGRPLTEQTYDESEPIVSPLRKHDCCLETDSAVAIILAPSDQARNFDSPACYLLSTAYGCDGRAGAKILNARDFDTANFKPVAKRLYDTALVSPEDVDVVQSYENFTHGVVMSLIEHGLCTTENASDLLKFENLLSGSGTIPLNTSGGHMAEAYVQGMNLCAEAVRQIRGTSCNQVQGAEVSLVSGGPLTAPVSSLIFGAESTL